MDWREIRELYYLRSWEMFVADDIIAAFSSHDVQLMMVELFRVKEQLSNLV